MAWGIVIGVDEYSGDVPRLSAAVRDATAFYDWLVSDTGGGVPAEHVKVLLGRAPDDEEERVEGEDVPSKDNIMRAINDVMQMSDGTGDRLFFYFSGHGVLSTYANREESAIAAADFDEAHPDRTLAGRSILEFFETTRFEDQFFFFDACRVRPTSIELPIGGWTIPRRRDPGQPPVQQFVLYATAPGEVARELGWPGEAVGAFSGVLIPALRGEGRAKAWSWEANCYEVRWERLANYVKRRMTVRSTENERVQVPQDAGCRGVLNRPRDARLATLSGRGATLVDLTLDLNVAADDEVDLTVVDEVGEVVRTALRVKGPAYTFQLPSRTYAVNASVGMNGRKGRLPVPVELYDDPEDMQPTVPLAIDWDTHDGDGEGDAEVTLSTADPLAVAEVRDQTEGYLHLATAGTAFPVPRGLYVLRELGPEPRSNGDDQQIFVRPGERRPVELPPPAVDAYAAELAQALGGSCENGAVVPVAGAEPVGWAQPSTVLAAGLGAVIRDENALSGLGLASPLAGLGEHPSGIALYAVAKDRKVEMLRGLHVRAWPAADPVPPESERRPLEPTESGVAQAVWPIKKVGPHWISIESADEVSPTVVALPVLEGRLATVVAQLDPGRLRLYQFHPLTQPHDSNDPGRLRRAEHLQRVLLGGRVDIAEQLANEVAGCAHDDPIAGCLAGYVLLRLGSYEPLDDLAAAVVEVAPKLGDAFILRAEHEAHKQNLEGRNQAVADAVSTGVPVLAEGLTRLVEGIRASGFFHPRGALVRYIFQQHARGSMWSAFTPRGTFEAGRLVITGSDVGYEA